MSSEHVSDSHQNDDEGLKRRNSLERYRPGAFSKEEREKLRQRAHFGERRLNGKENQSNGGGQGHHKRNYRGRGRGRGDFHTYRNGRGDQEDEVEEAEPVEEVSAPPPPIGNWADDLSDASPEASPKKTEPEVKDLREKLNSMRMNSAGHHGGNQRHHQRNGSGDKHRNGHGHKSGGGRNHQNQQHYQPRNLPMPKKNTVNFDPSHEPSQMRIIAAEPGLKKYNRVYQTRDVVMVNDIFCQPGDLSIYNSLLDEIQNSGVEPNKLWQLWHGDSHVIADDKKMWKEKCPTFKWVVDKMADYFGMDVKATRFNWYRHSSEWKPFHHDAAAMKERFAKTQNFTLAVSFGAERDAAFEHAQTKTIISMPQPNGSVYTFGRDVNILWRHGIPQLPPEKQSDEGRISIIAWGWIEMEDV